jgi:hypothetical protein
MRLYVGNLAFNTTENDLQDAFERFGTVSDVKIMMDQGSGRSRGFGFVTMGTAPEGTAAISGLDGQDLDGRNLMAAISPLTKRVLVKSAAAAVAAAADTPVVVASAPSRASAATNRNGLRL